MWLPALSHESIFGCHANTFVRVSKPKALFSFLVTLTFFVDILCSDRVRVRRPRGRLGDLSLKRLSVWPGGVRPGRLPAARQRQSDGGARHHRPVDPPTCHAHHKPAQGLAGRGRRLPPLRVSAWIRALYPAASSAAAAPMSSAAPRSASEDAHAVDSVQHRHLQRLGGSSYQHGPVLRRAR